ncbi:uncharacterized protein LOC114521899 [Dendronephthya gigantea]|uniref:uncharacterized protein LOC114521899 n=1 Tax=Dendronephthya gigantea TaxID=151771 RepID=UPI00106B4697|nr:uncharacterized protein LOC114521899 [Dendronephthya gigantea]
MGQCFGTDCSSLCPRWALRKNRGFDRFTNYAPRPNSSRYGDDHLLNEYQDQQDEIDFSGVGKNIYNPGPSEVVIDISKDTRLGAGEHLKTSSSNPNYSSVSNY